jgi:hypothetical protein
MPVTEHLLERAKSLQQAGKNADAQILFQSILKSEPGNETAWFAYLDTCQSDEERLHVLTRFLRACPHNAAARDMLAEVSARRKVPSAVPVKTDRWKSLLEMKLNPTWVRWGALAVIGIALAVGLVYFLSGATARGYVRELSGRLTAEKELKTLTTDYANLEEAQKRLVNDHASLWERFNQLETDFKALSQKADTLQTDQTNAQTDRDRLAGELGALKGQYTKLQQDYNSLQGQYKTLLDSYNNLQTQNTSLQDEYSKVQQTAVMPPYIHIHDRMVDITFVRTNGGVQTWTVPFEALENSIQMGYKRRENPLNTFTSTINLSGPAGLDCQVTDFSAYVDSSPFADVIPALYEDVGSDEAFIQEVWKITTQLTSYSSEIKETPRYPLETFLAGGGDCEDTSILLASMLKAAPRNYDVALIYTDGDHPTNPKTVNHMVVYVNTGERAYYIETTEGQTMEPYPDGVKGCKLPLK